jgi:glycosyltransferase involved in cell wall biosynthesis
MSKPFLLFRGPVKSVSGYGAHSRDLLESLHQMNLFDIKIDSCVWGSTPLTALNKENLFHNWIESNIVESLSSKPDIYIQVTVPNEFMTVGNFNIGITAGIETTLSPKDWIDGCNRMDLVITTSQFSKNVLLSTVYNETEKGTNRVLGKIQVTKPIEVLFEGVNDKVYSDKLSQFDLNIKEDFCFLFVGHWLKGIVGQDRKDVAMLIKTFASTFNNDTNSPALILKTSSATFSVKERENMRMKIRDLVMDIPNPPSIYLLFGELTDNEMSGLYNHPKVKSMVSFTKGEGFGRPLLEFSMTGKPVVVSNWSGHKDFLPEHMSTFLIGQLNDVHDSAIDNFIIKDSKWFTVDYDNASMVLKKVKTDYQSYLDESNKIKINNVEKFSLSKMTERFKEILNPIINRPTQKKLILPELKKIS